MDQRIDLDFHVFCIAHFKLYKLMPLVCIMNRQLGIVRTPKMRMQIIIGIWLQYD